MAGLPPKRDPLNPEIRVHDPVAEMPPGGPVAGGERGRMRAILMLGAAMFAISLGINMHVAVNVNYLHELLKASSWQQGYLESIRETCGVLSFFVIALLVGRSEPRLSALMVVLMGFGLAGYRWLNSVPQVILFSLIWSFGFHVWAPIGASMQLALARRGREGETMGIFGSVGAMGVLASLGGVWFLRTQLDLGMREMLLGGGIISGLAALPLLAMPDIRARRALKLSFRAALSGRYRLYCGLELLDGMRRQLFVLFAVLVLVREHGVKVETIALLMLANHVLCLGLAPLAGRLVDRVGERPVLSLYFAGVGAVFLLYTVAASAKFLFAIYVVDNVLFVLRVALPTYLNRIASPGERTQILALGTTMNHVGAVSLPLAGGAHYALLGYRFPFYCGALIAALSVALARRIPSRS